MAENLNYEANGKCYDNDPANGEIYGRLYIWDEAKKSCPPGWHLPSKEEWDTLMNFAGGEDNFAADGINDTVRKLKAKFGWDWDDYLGNSRNGTDEYGFSALPGGCGKPGRFGTIGTRGYWWSADDAGNACFRFMSYNTFWFKNDNDDNLCSVRCVKN